MPVLVDTNVLLDVAKDDPKWADRSLEKLEALALREGLFINAVVYAELSVGFDRLEDVDRFLDAVPAELLPIPPAAAFLAGKAFVVYRRGGGSKTGVLPDFFIGAHASVERMTLLTRDRRRYRHYFPALDLLSPES